MGWCAIVEITDITVAELGIRSDKIKTRLSTGTHFKHGSLIKPYPAACLSLVLTLQSY